MKKKIRLTGKIYSIEFLTGMIFYSLGMLLSTPKSNPPIIKYIAVASMTFVLSAIIVWFLFRNSEKMDERARYNLSKASNLTIITTTLFFFLTGLFLLFFSINIQLSAGIMSFAVAAILVFHALSFITFENIGI